MNRSISATTAVGALAVLFALEARAQVSVGLANDPLAVVSPLGVPSTWPRVMLFLPENDPAELDVDLIRHSSLPRWSGEADFRFRKGLDALGYRHYSLVFAALSSRETSLQIRARVRKTERRLGLPAERRTTAVGIAIPWRQYGFELEGIDDGNLGKALLGTLRWTASDERFGCGITVPLAAPRGLTGAVILQLVYRFANPPAAPKAVLQ